MPLLASLRRAVDVFRKVKALIFVLLQPLLPSAWFSGTTDIAVMLRGGGLHAGEGGMGSFPNFSEKQ